MHAYPQRLAAKLLQLWHQKDLPDTVFQLPAYETWDALPPEPALEQLVSTCYQASLMREEGRPVTFRLMLCNPELLDGNDSTRMGPLRRLTFEQPVALDPNELRRLAPAADFEQVLIGVRVSRERQLEIWGLVHSGSDWIRALEGSRLSMPLLPPSLVVGVLGPGHLAACRGSRLVVRLLAGHLSTPAESLLFAADDEIQAEAQAQLMTEHEKARRLAPAPWAKIDPDLIRIFRPIMALRTIHAVRRTRHGGTLLFLPWRRIRRPRKLGRHLHIKYAFSGNGSARSFHGSLVRLLNALAESCGRRFGPDKVVRWDDYLSSTDPAVVETDRILTDTCRLIAGASAVDGAVVLEMPFELVGFGAEILGTLPYADSVARALNRDGSRSELVPTRGVGMRHRSVYRLCSVLPETIAVVVSQDGEVHFVRNVGGQVIYWEEPSLGSMMG
jgi:hypothetical protein